MRSECLLFLVLHLYLFVILTRWDAPHLQCRLAALTKELAIEENERKRVSKIAKYLTPYIPC